MGDCLLLAQRLPPPVNLCLLRNTQATPRNVVASAAASPKDVAKLAQKFFKGKGNDKMDALFEDISQAQQEQIERQRRVAYKVRNQLDLERVQLSSWRNFHNKLLGDLQGTYADPEPGEAITFSKFQELLERGQVKHMEYANYGQHIAVILPHYLDSEEVSRQAVTGEGPVVYKRHWVEKMPADGMGDVWKLLHPQLKTIQLVETNGILNQLRPPLQIMTVWGMRIALASAIYWFLDTSLAHFMRFRDPDERGWNEASDLNADFVLGPWAESRARFISAEETTGVTFDDFAGQDYIKQELKQVVKLLKESKDDPTVFVPKGVLLHGPPGTGKTLLARAIAGEAGLPFFSSSGSEFVEMFAGVAAARVKDLFSRARSYAPSIIFIDEIDAIGAKRGGSDIGGGGAEREQGLVQMLTELDGFQSGLSRSRVLVIGATNRLDMLDPALLRKGRFDKILPVGIPSEEGRLAILEVHAKNKAFQSEEEKRKLLLEISKTTNRFSGAELANVLNEAVILATRHNKDYIEKAELEEAIAREGGTFATGQEDVLDVSGEARSRLAYREAAVAVLHCCFPSRHSTFIKTNVRKMKPTVNMQFTEPPETIYAKKHEYVELAIRTCAPRVVEELIFGAENLSWLSGTFMGEAASHIDRLLFQTGMTALGKTFYRSTKDIIPHLTPKIQALRDEYMRYAMQKCSAVLREYRSALETMADRLMEKSELEAAEVWEIFKKSPRIPQPEVLPVDEYGTLMEHGRWGIYGLSLPGRVTFRPGNVGSATYGAPKPIQVQYIPDAVWDEMHKVNDARLARMEKLLETKEGRELLEGELLTHYYYAEQDYDLE